MPTSQPAIDPRSGSNCSWARHALEEDLLSHLAGHVVTESLAGDGVHECSVRVVDGSQVDVAACEGRAEAPRPRPVASQTLADPMDAVVIAQPLGGSSTESMTWMMPLLAGTSAG